MKITIKILNWINRLMMIHFIITLLIPINQNECCGYSLYLAFVLGVYQLTSFLIILFMIKKLEIRKANEIISYIIIVILYFLIGHFVMDDYSRSSFKIIFQISLIGIPIILSIFWTYILESINQEL